MREGCLECVIKHLGQAFVLTNELENYPHYHLLIVGHLAEAAEECPYEEIAKMIRTERKAFQDNPDYVIDFFYLYSELLDADDSETSEEA